MPEKLKLMSVVGADDVLSYDPKNKQYTVRHSTCLRSPARYKYVK